MWKKKRGRKEYRHVAAQRRLLEPGKKYFDIKAYSLLFRPTYIGKAAVIFILSSVVIPNSFSVSRTSD